MDFINFNIRKWLALCPNVTDITHWEQLVEKHPACLGIYNSAPVHLIPAMMRRRMSSLTKLALQTALQLSVDEHIDYIVFASRHGELTRTVKLLEDIISGEDASPILFSQSVHNTAGGLFTITSKQKTPVCSLAAGENTLYSALIEAGCYLKEYPENKVLLVNFDEPLPVPYQVYEDQPDHSFSFGLLLESGNQIEVKQLKETHHKTDQLPQAFSCIDALLNDKTAVINGHKGCWLWKVS